VGYQWKPIEGLPPEAASLGDGELSSLALVWRDIRERAESTAAISEFLARLKREWSVHTGLIEGIYAMRPGVTEVLIRRGLDAALIGHGNSHPEPEEVVQIIRDHQETLEMLFAFVKQERQLTVGYVKEIHASLVRHQTTRKAVDQFGRPVYLPLEPGVFKTMPNNPMTPEGEPHEYCPPEQVSSEMDRLVALYRSHEGLPIEVQSAWLHHAFTQIHPFPDGNGRVARSLATIVLIRAGLFPLTIREGPERDYYIDCLRRADLGDIRPLVKLFVDVQIPLLEEAVKVAKNA
jgi:hypothetical protein